jgi:hypothetical protein
MKIKLICQVNKSKISGIKGLELPANYYGTQSGRVWVIYQCYYGLARIEKEDEPHFFARRLMYIKYDYRKGVVTDHKVEGYVPVSNVVPFLESQTQHSKKKRKVFETLEEAENYIKNGLVIQ